VLLSEQNPKEVDVFTRLISRLTTFTGINALLAATNILMVWILTDILGVHYLVSTMVGYTAHAVFGFFAQQRYTFAASKIGIAKGLSRTLLIECFGVPMMLGSTAFFYEVLARGVVQSRLLSLLVVGTFDYVAHSFITFRVNPFK